MSEQAGRRRRGHGIISGVETFQSDSGPGTELVGWAEPLASGALGPGATRAALAAALDLHVDEISDLSDDAARRALQRLRGLADQANRLATEAETDDLTGALRRGAGLAAIGREIARARRGTDARLCVAFVDVDGLKQVNDTQGHPAGDQLLRDVVTVLRERLRAYDLVIRYGGDEFVLALPGLDTPGAERLFVQVGIRLAARTQGRSISVGLAELGHSDDVASILARADAALVAQRQARDTARTR